MLEIVAGVGDHEQFVGGQAVKGPTAKMMRELGLEASAAGVAARYGDLLDGYVVDEADTAAAGKISARVTMAPGNRCERCWKVLPEVGQAPRYTDLCLRCAAVVDRSTESASAA